MDLDELETHDGAALSDNEGGACEWSGFGSPTLAREEQSEQGTHGLAVLSYSDSGFDWPSATEIDQVCPCSASDATAIKLVIRLIRCSVTTRGRAWCQKTGMNGRVSSGRFAFRPAACAQLVRESSNQYACRSSLSLAKSFAHQKTLQFDASAVLWSR